MGDPISADKAASSPSVGAPTAATSRAVPDTEDEWDVKWRAIERGGDTVGWVDHFQICALKYRYRNYAALFRCLDAFEAKVAQRDDQSGIKYARRAGPTLVGWLRASADADLGQPDSSLQWAESAWAALPSEYRNAEKMPALSDFGFVLKPDEFTDFVRGVSMVAGYDYQGILIDKSIQGRRNPAGLDMAPETVAMSLAGQRALLHQRRGESAEASAALAQLTKWQQISSPLKAKAQLLSLGPLFAMGRYAEVVAAYDQAAARQTHERERVQASESLAWILFPVKLLQASTAPFSPKDTRRFAVAVEDASNALIYAQSLARLGKSKQAAAMLDTLLAMPELPAMGNLYWATLYERAVLALGDGERDRAIELLRRSADAIESVRSTIAFEAAKIGFAGDKQAVYATLVRALADNGDWRSAFVAVERAKARSLVDLLAERRDIAPPSNDDSVRSLLAQATVESAGLPASDEAMRSIKLVADARAALATAAPEAASLVSVQAVDIEQVVARLGERESLIDYYEAGDDLFALILNRSAVTGFKLSAAGLDNDVRAFRTAIEHRSAEVGPRARALYDRLLRPLAPSLASELLTISPHGALHYLPFDALIDGDAYLLDRYALRVTPSAGALAYLRSDRPTKVGTLLALGNPDLGDARYDLPNAQVEAQSVAALFPASRALVRSDASKAAVKSLGSGFAMLHFATHGKFDAEAPLASGLYLAAATPADGVLTVGDLYTLRFDADLVTLSACETGLGKIASGDDVIGLTRGFLYAGARTIVASLWQVDDAATAELMVAFYRDLQGTDKRDALRRAQIETRAKYPQPLFWAAFQEIGNGD